MSADAELDDISLAKDPNILADEAARSLQGVLEEAGISGDVLRNVVDKVRQRGRGGRTPAGDPRLDPNIEPKKAKRILANRLSAAKSKMRQRVLNESLELLKTTQGGNAAMALLPQPISRERDRDMRDRDMRDRDMPYREREVSSSQGRANQQDSDDMCMEDLRSVCYDLQVRNRELEDRVTMLETQFNLWTSPLQSLQASMSGQFRMPSGLNYGEGATAAMLAAAMGAGMGLPSTRLPSQNVAGSGAASLAAAASAFSSYVNPGGGGGRGMPGGGGAPRSGNPLTGGGDGLSQAQIQALTATLARESSHMPASWLMEYSNLGMGQLMMPRVPLHPGAFPPASAFMGTRSDPASENNKMEDEDSPEDQ